MIKLSLRHYLPKANGFGANHLFPAIEDVGTTVWAGGIRIGPGGLFCLDDR